MDKVTNDLEIPPRRDWNDFFLDSARFQIPNLKDLNKWNNRVVQNLIYYQTNYFYILFGTFFITGLLHPVKMLVGTVTMIVIIVIFAYVSTEGRAVHNFKKQYPAAGLIFILLGSCFVMYTLGSLLVFLFGILMSLAVIFLHASLRLRHIKNKLVNKIEGSGLRRTPMGVLLEELGMGQEYFG
ncbi:PRA1 family protein 3 [Orussus abietinus]|uniref:PRA1 family protein 3 n=1 Tax=Orussus abietinus TaxID=222816 RepID=UPI000624FB58|nr:PRA1 family protein 3 [Orussus abietinus]XP_023290816.1 PRA1 family protein 3 [Orussus abietinus]XP_023290817.1 PRA1 family protein 3 [Orussus abietinus]